VTRSTSSWRVNADGGPIDGFRTGGTSRKRASATL
jgi:hypothetical protein